MGLYTEDNEIEFDTYITMDSKTITTIESDCLCHIQQLALS